MTASPIKPISASSISLPVAFCADPHTKSLSAFLDRTLSGQPAAIHSEDGAVDVACRVAGEIDGRAAKIFRLAPTAGRNPFYDIGVANGIFAQHTRVVGLYVAGGNRVHIDALCGPFIGQNSRQTRKPAF